MAEGWVKLDRELLNWEHHQNTETLSLFIHLLLRANHKPFKTNDGREWPAGSVLTSYRDLSKTTGLTVRKIRTQLATLKSTQEVTHFKTPVYSVITIKNWDKFQKSTQKKTQKTTTYNKSIKKEVGVADAPPLSEDYMNALMQREAEERRRKRELHNEQG